jgi:hypothetical protein
MEFFIGKLIDSPITFIVICVGGILLLVLLKHVVRWTIKLITVLLLISAFIAIALIGYWQNWYSLISVHESRPSPTRRATAQH